MSDHYKPMRSHTCGGLRATHCDQTATLCGWVTKHRDLGQLHFIDLRDKHGITQLSFEGFTGDLSILKTITLESCIQVSGVVAMRPKEAQNLKMPTGEVELLVREIKILSICQDIPFLPHGSTTASEDLKLKYRYLDLRSSRLQNILQVRSDVTQTIRNRFVKEGFIEVETPILYKTTPEGARDYIVPSRVHKGTVYALPQSPQTLKQLLMIGNTDRYFQVCRCFRDEDLRADRQPEFTQVDFEASFVQEDDIRQIATQVISDVFELGRDFKLRVISYDEAMEKYGSDKPDLRFGLMHHLLNNEFAQSEFSAFTDIINKKGLVKGIFLPEAQGSLSRKQLDQLKEITAPFSSGPVYSVKVDNQSEFSGGMAKFFTSEIKDSLLKKAEQKAGMWLFVAHERPLLCHQTADALRRHLAQVLNLITKDALEFLWINQFPLYDFDPDAHTLSPCHHPFTAPAYEDLSTFYNGTLEEKSKVKAQAYDLVLNGYELGGGSIRIHDQKVQKQMFDNIGLTDDDIKNKFGFFIEALKFGTPPHGGMAFGLDRIIMLKVGTDSIRDVIAFPKTTKASDLMSQSPSAPAPEQVKELHFKWLS